MKIVEYTEEHSAALLSALDTIAWRAPLLRSPEFVRHYFLSRPACRLLLLVLDDGRVGATLGSERIGIEMDGTRYEAAVLSNTYSMSEGTFPFLYLHWMRSAEVGIAFPGNQLLRDMLARQPRWHAIPGLRTYWLNWAYPRNAGDPAWKALLKPLVRRLKRVDQESFPGRIARLSRGEIGVAEERDISADMAARRGAFGFRLAADLDHLNWRFATTLDYVRYRIFRVLRRDATAGYVVLAEWPHCVVVAHCDGDDAETLALGVLLAIATVNRGAERYRKVLLTSMHPSMQSCFHRFGFRPDVRPAAFAVATLGKHRIAVAPASNWLVNMELGETGAVAGLVFKP